jgi:serine/threonine protein phosphatase 1
MTQPRTIAVGDVHGCIHALDAVLDAIQPGGDDQLVLMGDYIDRGHESRAVIDRILELSGRCHVVSLLGNHELMLLRGLAAADERHFWLQFGGRETLDSYGGHPSGIPPAHLDFMRSCLRFFETETHFFVHANYAPDLDLSEQPESLLLWTHLIRSVPAPHKCGKIAVVGHTPQVSGEILDLGHLICVDTYCVGGGWLTALDVANRTVWQADRSGHMRTPDSAQA